MLSVHCDGTPRSFNIELQISCTTSCSSFAPHFKVSAVTAKSVPVNLFRLILLIAFRSSSNVKSSVQISRSMAAGGISVDLSSFLTFSSSLKYATHSFISSSLSVGDSPFRLFTKLEVSVVDFPRYL